MRSGLISRSGIVSFTLTSIPLCPYFLNVNGDWKAAPVRLRRRVVYRQRFAVKSGQRRLGIKVSTCEGPPLAKRWMTRLAFVAKCAARGASGELLLIPSLGAASATCEASRSASPIIPKPNPQRQRKSRRVRNRFQAVERGDGAGSCER